MKANAKLLCVGFAVVFIASLAWGQATTSPTNTTPTPTPVVRSDHQSHDTVTNAIVDPSGSSLATNRIPEITNTPTPMPTPLTASPKTPLPN